MRTLPSAARPTARSKSTAARSSTRCCNRAADGARHHRQLQRPPAGVGHGLLIDSFGPDLRKLRWAAVPPTYDVLAIGNAIVDVISHASDDFLIRHDLKKDSMQLVEPAR